MLNPNLPTTILRSAWNSIRLDVIRSAVAATIGQLEGMPSLTRGANSDVGRQRAASADHAARRACVEELREAAGHTADSDAVQALLALDDAAWRELFQVELARYRAAAALSLRNALGDF